jgi:small subunit ribosomal protein S10e
MLISKENRKAVYSALFKGKQSIIQNRKFKEYITYLYSIDGALVAPKDFNLPKHADIDVPNLEVIKLMQSLTSKGLVKTQFSWQWYYYTLTDEGIDYLRECML